MQKRTWKWITYKELITTSVLSSYARSSKFISVISEKKLAFDSRACFPFKIELKIRRRAEGEGSGKLRRDLKGLEKGKASLRGQGGLRRSLKRSILHLRVA